MNCKFCKCGAKHIGFPQAKKARSFHKNILLPEIFHFFVTDEAVAVFGDLQLKVNWKFLFILQYNS